MSLLHRVVAWVTRLLDRANSVVRDTPKGARLGGVVRWVLWCPRNARIVVWSLTGIVVAAFVLFVGAGLNRASSTEAARAAAAEATGAPSGIGVPTVAPTTGEALPLDVDPKQDGQDETETPDADIVTEVSPFEAAPRKAATTFLTVWLDVDGKYPTVKAWLAALKPVTTPNLYALTTSTDRANIPMVGLKGLQSVTYEGESSVDATLTDGQVLSVMLDKDKAGAWRVASVQQAE